jgi:hypothetical protein
VTESPGPSASTPALSRPRRGALAGSRSRPARRAGRPLGAHAWRARASDPGRGSRGGRAHQARLLDPKAVCCP